MSCDDKSIPDDSELRQWERHCIKACETVGATLIAPMSLKRWLEEAGFVDVEERQYKLPMNTWPRDKEMKLIGRYQHVQYKDALQPYALGLLVDILGWTREEMEVFLMGLRRDLANRSFHGYNIVYV